MILSRVLAALQLLVAPIIVQAANDDPDFTHDPFVVRRDDGRYFRFSTLHLIGIWEADNLDGPWEMTGIVIKDRSIIDMDGNDVLWVLANPHL